MAQQNSPPRARGALYSLGARDVRPETLKLVDEIEYMLQPVNGKTRYGKNIVARAIEVSILKAVNAERKELAAFARELDIPVDHDEIRAATSRLSSTGIAQTAIDVCRGLFARLCAERISTG